MARRIGPEGHGTGMVGTGSDWVKALGKQSKATGRRKMAKVAKKVGGSKRESKVDKTVRLANEAADEAKSAIATAKKEQTVSAYEEAGDAAMSAMERSEKASSELRAAGRNDEAASFDEAAKSFEKEFNSNAQKAESLGGAKAPGGGGDDRKRDDQGRFA